MKAITSARCAAWNMTMGRCDTPLRRILNRAQDLYCQNMPIWYVHTVVESLPTGEKKVRGLYAGQLTRSVFRRRRPGCPSQLLCHRASAAHRCRDHERPQIQKNWLANKAVYRTRMLVGDGGKLVIHRAGCRWFRRRPRDRSHDSHVRLLTTPEVLEAVANNEDLSNNLSAAAT